MKSELTSELMRLEVDLDCFYDKDFDDSSIEYDENKKIKVEIIKLIISAFEKKQGDVVDEAMKFLFEHTGCEEDYHILKEVISPLYEIGVINDDRFNKCIARSPLSRWG